MQGYHEIISRIKKNDIPFLEHHADEYFITIPEILMAAVDVNAMIVAYWAFQQVNNMSAVNYIIRYGTIELIRYVFLKTRDMRFYHAAIRYQRFDAATQMRHLDARLTTEFIVEQCINDNYEGVKFIVTVAKKSRRSIREYLSMELHIPRCSPRILTYLYCK